VIFSLLAPMSACGGGDAADVPIHDRLWLTAIPKKTTDTVGALMIVRASESRQYGGIFKGSLWRGVYDSFHWQPEGEHRAHMRMLQDDKVFKVRTEPCEPTTGFHYCVLVHGDPQGEVRYQSRRLWGLTRPKATAQAFDLAAELAVLAEQDEELAGVLAQAEAEVR